MPQPSPGAPGKPPKGPRAWVRRIVSTTRDPGPEQRIATPAPEKLSVYATLRTLPALLDSSSLPNGVVELLIEDLDAPISQVFDIHDGHIALAEPGQCVPWASIAGPPVAWAMALGPERNVPSMQLTGDKQLAQRLLAALPSPS